MASQVKITPAPGYVLVVQKKSTGGEVGGVLIAAKENPLHEGTVGAIGFVPHRFRSMRLKRGDVVTFARFNAVNVPGTDDGYLAVGMQHIVCKKEESAYSESRWSKFLAMFHFSMLGAAFAAGYFTNDARAWIKRFFQK